MPYSQKHKAQSRQRIVASAYNLFSSRGYENVSINEIMADAKMTRGAFYAHFGSKSKLYKEAIQYAANQTQITSPKPEHLDSKIWIEKLIKEYLSKKHITGSCRCPLASLATDVVVREPEVRKAYTDTFKGLNKLMHEYTKTFSQADKDTVLATSAMMIGGLAIARALDDKTCAERLLKSCQKEAMALLEKN